MKKIFISTLIIFTILLLSACNEQDSNTDEANYQNKQEQTDTDRNNDDSINDDQKDSNSSPEESNDHADNTTSDETQSNAPGSINPDNVNLGDFTLFFQDQNLHYQVNIHNNTGADLLRIESISLKLYYQGGLFAEAYFSNITIPIQNGNSILHTFIFGPGLYDPDFVIPSGQFATTYSFKYTVIFDE